MGNRRYEQRRVSTQPVQFRTIRRSPGSTEFVLRTEPVGVCIEATTFIAEELKRKYPAESVVVQSSFTGSDGVTTWHDQRLVT